MSWRRIASSSPRCSLEIRSILLTRIVGEFDLVDQRSVIERRPPQGVSPRLRLAASPGVAEKSRRPP